MTNKTYDTLKTIALVATPIITFLAALCTIWNVPYCEQITASLAALDTLIGAFVIKSSMDYKNAGMTQMFNEDLLKDMLGYGEDLHELGELESEADEEV